MTKKAVKIELTMAQPDLFVVIANNGKSFVVQQETDLPGLASTFGWDIRALQKNARMGPPCRHGGTDGSIDCPVCKLPVEEFIESARQFLMAHQGSIVSDLGYFDETD